MLLPFVGPQIFIKIVGATFRKSKTMNMPKIHKSAVVSDSRDPYLRFQVTCK